MKVYVTGASGRLGKALISVLEGCVPLVRKPSGLKDEIVTDFSPDSLRKILKDADVVVHLAGSRDFLDMAKARKGNVELTKDIVDALPKSSKIVFSSSISVYGKKMAKVPADEKTQTRPDTAYARTKLEAEGVVAAHPKHVILRIGPIYGEGFGEYFRVLRMLEKGKMPIIGDGRNRIPFVHVDDVVSAIVAASDRGQGAYVITGRSIAQKDVYELASKELGVEAPKTRLPVTLAKTYARFELFRSSHLGGKAKFIPEDIAVLSSDRAYDCAKAEKELGFRPRSVSKGIAEMVRQYKQKYKA